MYQTLQTLNDLIIIWWACGITWMTIDWLRGWPKCVGSGVRPQAYIKLVKQINPKANPRMFIVRGVLFVHLLAGPFAYLIQDET